MRTNSFQYKETLAIGLRDDTRSRRDALLFARLRGMKPTSFGLVEVPVVESSIEADELSDNSIAFVWPFPQLFKGKAVTLLVDEDRVFEVDSSTWELTQITTFDSQSILANKSITPGGMWQFVDMHTNWMLLNENCVVFKYAGVVYVNDTYKMNTACLAAGRVISGGFRPEDSDRVWGTLARNMIQWSKVGGGDVYWNLLPSLTIPSDLRSADLQGNEKGYAVMDWQGSILCIKELGKGAVVYGEDGVTILVPVVEPAPTLFMKQIASVGVASRGAVGGDLTGHIFVDTEGILWRISEKFEIEALGYKEFFEDERDEEIVITKDSSREQDYYICSRNRGLILSKTGLGELNQLVTSLIRDNSLEGISHSLGEDIYIETDTFDINIRGSKTIQSIEVATKGVEDFYVCVLFSVDGGKTFLEAEWQIASEKGIVFPNVTAEDFRIAIRSAPGLDFKVESILVQYQAHDKTNRRGAYSAAGNSNANSG